MKYNQDIYTKLSFFKRLNYIYNLIKASLNSIFLLIYRYMFLLHGKYTGIIISGGTFIILPDKSSYQI